MVLCGVQLICYVIVYCNMFCGRWFSSLELRFNCENSSAHFTGVNVFFIAMVITETDSYGVPTEEGIFPYQWFSDLSKLDAPSLTIREDFFLAPSKGVRVGVSEEAYQECTEAWEGMDSSGPQKTFRDYVRLYVGLTQVIEKMLTIERENKLQYTPDKWDLHGGQEIRPT